MGGGKEGNKIELQDKEKIYKWKENRGKKDKRRKIKEQRSRKKRARGEKKSNRKKNERRKIEEIKKIRKKGYAIENLKEKKNYEYNFHFRQLT